MNIVDHLEKSMAGEVCAVLGCKEEPTKKCDICGAHYCKEHIKSHLHTITEVYNARKKK